MNVLFLAHRVPYPPVKGDKIRSSQWVAWLRERHRVRVVAGMEDRADREALAALAAQLPGAVGVPVRRPAAWLRTATALPGRRPLTNAYFPTAALERAARRLLARERADVAVAFSGQTAPVALRLGVPVVLDLVDRDASKWAQYQRHFRGFRAWLAGLEARRLGRAEEAWVRAAAATVVVSETERALFPAALRERVHVLPHAVPADRFAAGEREDDGRTLLFVGALDYPPNADAVCFFADAVLPRIRAARPEVRFWVAGRRPPRSLRRRARAGVLTLLGHVPDLAPLYRQAALTVASFRLAQGLLNKVLEALAWGVPVLATPAAVRGLGPEAGPGLRVATDAEGLAQAALELLADPAARRRLGAAGQAWVKAHYAWPGRWPAVEELLALAAGTLAGAA